MKNKIDNKYIYWGLTSLCVIAAAILFYFLMLRFNLILTIIGKIFYILKPLFYGLIIAFLLTISFNYFDSRIYKLLSKKFKDKDKIRKVSKVISITISLLLLFLFLFFIIYIMIPKLVVSILAIIESLPTNIDNVENWLRNILKGNTVLQNIILSTVNKSSNSIIEWISEGVLPMENILNGFTNSLNGMYIFLKDFIIGIAFSVYILINKKVFLSQTKKIMYGFLGIKKGNTVLQGARYSYNIFNGFVKGKLLSSLFIGIACYISMVIFKIPYALLLSFIITVTNIIPFFGALIGWIPGVVILLLVDPMQALYFTILTVILQQVEGNIVGPKLVSNSTGISSFWVLFSIVIFGGIFGFIGMVVGVPIFAILYHLISFYLKKYLEKKNLPPDTKDYEDLKYIDEKTGDPVKIKSSNQ